MTIPDHRYSDLAPVHRWGRWEGRFTSQFDYPEPLQTVDLTVELSAPSGTKHTARAFWDGDRTWRVRFCPDEVGSWDYQTDCSNPADGGLHQRRGTFECHPYDGENPLYRHGQIRVAASGRHLEHQDSKPFFFLADTTWHGPHVATAADWNHYLDDRVSKRFSAILFSAPHLRYMTANADGRLPFYGRERIRIEPTFFQRLDGAVDAINTHGLLATPLLLHGGGDSERNVAAFLPEDQLILFARYLIARYDAHHVLWDFLAEADFHGNSGRRWHRIGRAVFSGGRRHPVTLHPYGNDWALYDFIDESWMDVAGYQSAHGDNEVFLRWITEGPPSSSWRLHPPRPFINLEPPYEGHLAYHSKQPFDAATVRRHLYWSLLSAPTAGVGYGCQGLWAWDTRSGDVPFAAPETGISRAWHEALDYPGAVSLCHLVALMESIPWWELRPAPEMLGFQPGRDDPRLAVVASRTIDGCHAVVYVPRGSNLVLGLDARPLRAVWADPRTGDQHIVTVPATDGTWTVPTPDDEDWVLLLALDASDEPNESAK